MLHVPTDNEINMLCSAEMLAIDCETKDPELKKKGPGTKRGDGFVCGLATASDDFACYLPFAHPDVSQEYRDKFRKIASVILKSNTPKLGANLIYDLEWLRHEQFDVNMSELHDVQYAEPMLDEYKRTYSLESLGQTHLGEGKRTTVLEDYHSQMGWPGKAIENIWRVPARIAEEYAMTDVKLPLEIFKKQKELLEQQGLWDLYAMETKLIPLLLKMRDNGVRLDIPKLQTTTMAVTEKHFALKERLFDWAEQELNINSSAQLAKIFDKKGIPYPRKAPTALMLEKGKEGNPNLDKKALGRLVAQFPICETILEFRHYDTLINMFLHPYLELQVAGRLYGSFHPLRSDDYGTVAGRFSASKPNLQQVSAQNEDSDDELGQLKGKILRELFLPEEGLDWAKLDYSQIEYRIMAHYASGKGAQELRDKYNFDPNTDMHQLIMDATGFDRRTSKRLNFGGAYGMGIPTASDTFGWTIEEGAAFMNGYHAAAPYVKATRNKVSKVAARRGYIFTILGRKARTHPSRKLHSMFNRLIQGSAADVMKKAMVDADSAGLFDVLVPHLTVHDELDVSYESNALGLEALSELKYRMESAVKFDVPIVVDCHTGRNWAEAD